MSMPELGSKISLISKADIRYEGKLFTVDPQECTIALSHVQSFGTEDRPTEFKVPAQSQIYNYILFRGSDIKDIKVITPQIPLNDPAIVQLSVPPNMGGFNANYQPIDELGSASQVGNSYNPMSGVNLNAGPSHKQASESPLILDPQPVIQPKQPMTAQSDVLDLISGGASRSSTPAQPNAFNGQQNSPTFDQGITVGIQQSSGNSRGGKNHRNRSTSSTSDTRKQVRQQGQNYQRNDQQQHYQRNDQHYQRNDFHQQDNNFANRQGGNRNMNGRNWNNQNNQQQQVRRQNTATNVTGGGRSFYNRSTGLPAPSKAQGPRSNSLKFDEDYDFDKANSEFQEIIKKLSRTKLDDGLDNSNEEVSLVNGGSSSLNGESVVHANGGEQVTSKKTNRVDSGNENETEGDDEQKVFYDKTKSFFDTISCEAVERSKGHSQRTDWRTERKLNSETFGVAMAKRGQYHRGRGGYYHNNNSNYRPNPNSYNNGNSYNNNRQGVNYNYRQHNNGYMRNNPNNRGYNFRPRPNNNKQDQRQQNAVSPQRVAVA